MKKRILVVEDEPSLQMMIEDNLRFEGYEVFCETSGKRGLALALQEALDLIVLDIMLPELDGYTFCRELKAKRPDLPILIVSARDQVVDVIRGLELGADDYLRKPFDIAELLMRIRVRLRLDIKASDTTSFGPFRLHRKKQSLHLEGEPLALTNREFQLLQYLVDHHGQPLAREEILKEVWGYHVFSTTRTVDNYILKLRKLLEDDPSKPRWILSVRGVGYRFRELTDGADDFQVMA